MIGRGELMDEEWAICFCLPLVGYLGARVPGNQRIRDTSTMMLRTGEGSKQACYAICSFGLRPTYRRRSVEPADHWCETRPGPIAGSQSDLRRIDAGK